MRNLLHDKHKRIIYATLTFVLCFTVVFTIVGMNVSANNTTTDIQNTSDTENVSETVQPEEQTEPSEEATTSAVSSSDEVRGVWISFLDYNEKGYTRETFTKRICDMFDKCKKNNFNTVFVHVRMFADAMYNSKYFPWSQYASGKIGKSPGFEPLRIMVSEAHKRGLAIHAWVNPYRITKGTTSVKSLAKSSYAYKWKTSKSASTKRNVLSYGGQLYFNPAKPAVRNLITNGIKEIVKNYNVDGIHFDDYFYPNLGTKYKKVFDAKEYRQYKKKSSSPVSIITWRRRNVDKLIHQVYSSVKKLDKKCTFGISPAGNIDNLYLPNSYYCDVKKWMATSGYIDYICPQIYWSFTQTTCPYKKVCKRWSSLKRHKNVELYIGLASYRAGIGTAEAKSIGDIGWSKSSTILKREILYARKTKNVTGFVMFSYNDLTRKSARKELRNATKLFK